MDEDDKLILADEIILAVSKRLDLDFTEELWAQLNEDIVAVLDESSMTPYRSHHADLFRTVAEILVRDYIAPSEKVDTVAEWYLRQPLKYTDAGNVFMVEQMEPSELAALIADVEGYERRQ